MTLSELELFFKQHPAELSDVVRCPLFDDFDDSGLSERQKQLCKQDKGRLNFLFASSRNKTSAGGYTSLGKFILQETQNILQIIIDTRPIWENARGKIHCQQDQLPLLCPEVQITGMNDMPGAGKGYASLGGVGIDIGEHDEEKIPSIVYMFPLYSLFALSGYGVEPTIMTHEAIHAWDDIDTYHNKGIQGILDASKLSVATKKTYLEARKKWEDEHYNNAHYFHPISKLPTYQGLTAMKKVYSTQNPAEHTVTEVFADAYQLTYDEAIELAHSPFMDTLVNLLMSEDRIDPIKVATHMKRSVLPLVTPKLQKLFKMVIAHLRDADMLKNKQDQLQMFHQMMDQIAQKQKQASA